MKTPRMRVVRRAARSSEIVSGIVAVAQTLPSSSLGRNSPPKRGKITNPAITTIVTAMSHRRGQFSRCTKNQ